MLAIPVNASFFRCVGVQRMASTRAQGALNNPEIANRKNTIIPSDQDPCVFAHRQNSKGTVHSGASSVLRKRSRTISRKTRYRQPNRIVRGPNETVARKMAQQHARAAALKFRVCR